MDAMVPMYAACGWPNQQKYMINFCYREHLYDHDFFVIQYY